MNRAPEKPRFAPKWTLAASVLASSLAFVDGSVTNVALPAIREDLAATPAQLQWVINAYLLPLSALLLFWGACELLRVALRRDWRAPTLVPLALVFAVGLAAWAYADSDTGWRWKVASSRDALRAAIAAPDHDVRHRAGHFIVDTVRHPCGGTEPWLWLGRPHGAGSGTNLALVHAGARL